MQVPCTLFADSLTQRYSPHDWIGVTAETIAAANERRLLAEGIQSVRKFFEDLE